MIAYRLTFITPLFSRGLYENQPEIRPPSIRGQLHHWFRWLGGDHAAEKRAFGSVHGGATSSRVVIRVANVHGQTATAPTLPHKGGGHAAPKTAFLPGTTFELHILPRLRPLSEGDQRLFDRALEGWLLMGSLGLRSTRAAGSFVWEPIGNAPLKPPVDFNDYEDRCHSLARHSGLRFALLHKTYNNAENARRTVSDTLGGREDRAGQDGLAAINHPLGRAFGGRKTSPLKFRIVSFGKEFRIAALWDNRQNVTGNLPADLQGIINLLAERKPDLGQQLAASRLADFS